MSTHRFTDRDGVEWRVSMRAAETIAVASGDRIETYPPGLLLECSTLVIRVPMRDWVDPRAIPDARLQAMIDREMEG